jgi:hypothetical protein
MYYRLFNTEEIQILFFVMESLIMAESTRILLIEDDLRLADLIRAYLTKQDLDAWYENSFGVIR